MICCKAYEILGLIKRLAMTKLDLSLKVLFGSLVHPILEYGVVLWNPHTSIAGNSRQPEMVQSFAGFIYFKYLIHHKITPLSQTSLFGMETLARRKYTC